MTRSTRNGSISQINQINLSLHPRSLSISVRNLNITSMIQTPRPISSLAPNRSSPQITRRRLRRVRLLRQRKHQHATRHRRVPVSISTRQPNLSRNQRRLLEFATPSRRHTSTNRRLPQQRQLNSMIVNPRLGPRSLISLAVLHNSRSSQRKKTLTRQPTRLYTKCTKGRRIRRRRINAIPIRLLSHLPTVNNRSSLMALLTRRRNRNLKRQLLILRSRRANRNATPFRSAKMNRSTQTNNDNASTTDTNGHEIGIRPAPASSRAIRSPP